MCNYKLSDSVVFLIWAVGNLISLRALALRIYSAWDPGPGDDGGAAHACLWAWSFGK